MAVSTLLSDFSLKFTLARDYKEGNDTTAKSLTETSPSAAYYFYDLWPSAMGRHHEWRLTGAREDGIESNEKPPDST